MSNKVNYDAEEWKESSIKKFFSKNLLDLPNGTVKILRVDALAEYPIHIHPDKTEYIYVLSGNPELIIGDDEYACSPNDFYILPATIKHAILNKTAKECILLVGAIKN
ncbi:MAG: cupin domain-containing protein [Bacteroidia bacterium]|nr:cupin domain-containing protein [Bacteroidia bacterium]